MASRGGKPVYIRATTHDPLFDGAWLKWAGGITHVKHLQRAIRAEVQAGLRPIRGVRAVYHPKRHGIALVVESVEPVPATWRLNVGDIANNFRAALDQLAWALVRRGRTPPGSGSLTPRAERSVYFPIGSTRDRFNTEIMRKLPGVRREDIAKVRRRQPYHHSSQRQWAHPIVYLATVNNSDKHRAIQPVWSKLLWGNHKVTNPRDCLLTYEGTVRISEGSTDVLQTNTEIVFFPVRRTGPEPKVDVQFDYVTAPALNAFLNVAHWIVGCEWLIASLLAEFSEPPSEMEGVEPIAPRLAERFASGPPLQIDRTVTLPLEPWRMAAFMAIRGTATVP